LETDIITNLLTKSVILFCTHCVVPRQTVGHSFGNHLMQRVSQCYTIDCCRCIILLCSFLCLYNLCEIQYWTKSFHLWLLCERKHIQILQEKISQHNMSGDNNFQISEESSNPRHFNRQKAVKRKLCYNWGKTWLHQLLIRKFYSEIFTAINTTNDVSLGSGWTTTKLLNIRLYKIIVVHGIKPVYY
jgi:hypothetical protein